MSVCFSLVFNFIQLFIPSTHGEDRQLNVNGIEREYIFYKPASIPVGKKVPLVLDFHGSGGTASFSEKESGFNDLADKNDFIAVYPNGINKGWNDGRTDSKLKHNADDLSFVLLLVNKLIKEENADPDRIFATGMSNGAFFSIYLAYKLPVKFKAVAPVCANIPAELSDSFSFLKPISLLLINGTADPLIKYNGGPIVSERAQRGRSLSTDSTIRKWLMADKINSDPIVEKMPDTEDDNCSEEKFSYSGGINHTSVTLIKINNGGHAWPGGKQYLPRFIIGNLCRDFSASETIWNFFAAQ